MARRTRIADFAAIDFETANSDRNSACAIGLAIVRDGRMADLLSRLIRPPSNDFSNTHVHGLKWKDVRNEPAFGEVWQDLSPLLDGLSFFAAHNAPFDRSVLGACCTTSGIPNPDREFVCTMRVARSVWNIYPTKLPHVCRHLNIPLAHHEAGSDAEACARIVLAAFDNGWKPSPPAETSRKGGSRPSGRRTARAIPPPARRRRRPGR